MIFRLFQAWRVQGPLRGQCDLSNRNGSMCRAALHLRLKSPTERLEVGLNLTSHLISVGLLVRTYLMWHQAELCKSYLEHGLLDLILSVPQLHLEYPGSCRQIFHGGIQKSKVMELSQRLNATGRFINIYPTTSR